MQILLTWQKWWQALEKDPYRCTQQLAQQWNPVQWSSQEDKCQRRLFEVATDIWEKLLVYDVRGCVNGWQRQVSRVNAVVCREYETRICGSKNFSQAWTKGSSDHKTSNIVNHTDSEPHTTAMMYFCRDQAKSRNEAITSYSPIACSLLSPTPMDPDVKERVKRKIDISYVLAKEHITF